MKRPTIEQAQARLTEKVLQDPGVVGTMIGECDGEPCIVVLLAVHRDELREEIAGEFEGYPVETRVTGEIKALE